MLICSIAKTVNEATVAVMLVCQPGLIKESFDLSQLKPAPILVPEEEYYRLPDLASKEQMFKEEPLEFVVSENLKFVEFQTDVYSCRMVYQGRDTNPCSAAGLVFRIEY